MQQDGTQALFPNLDGGGLAAARRRSHDAVSTARRMLTPPRLALGLIAALSLFLGLRNIGAEGFGNAYYAAAVRSMLENWHAFFFASLDSKGFVTVDKPPAGLWIQTASAWLFGYHGWSILLPQVLASVGSVLVVYALVRKPFGIVAGLIAAFALAVAPINVAVARNNTSDGLLAFAMLLGAACVLRAARSGDWRWLAGSMALIGVGFNIKMLEAYLVLPAFVAVYLFTARTTLWRRIWHLAVGGVALIGVSFSWATAVALTPASERPYIGSTQDNSIFSLIFGYNGLNRLLPRGWSIFGITNSTTTSGFSPAGGGGVGGTSENGPQGIFRLLDAQLGGQIGWLIPLAVIGLIVAWGRPRFRDMTDGQRALMLFGSWAAVEIGFFSVAGFYHRYYTSTLSPAIAALVGAGLVALWRMFRGGGWRAAIFPLALAVTAASQYRLLDNYPTWKHRLGPALIAGAAGAIVIFVLHALLTRTNRFGAVRARVVLRALLAVSVVTIFAAPSVWSYTTTTQVESGSMPLAGPSASTGIGGRGQAFGGNFAGANRNGATTDSALIAYLEANQGSAAYLLAVTSSQEADQIIISTGKAVMSMGGFSGSDPILTVDSLKQLIASGQIRFFMTNGRGFGGFGANSGRPTFTPDQASGGGQVGLDDGVGRTGRADRAENANAAPSGAGAQAGNSTVTQWIATNCVVVSSSDIAASAGSSSTSTIATNGLYDCKGAATS